MITLYQRTDCPFCWKVRLALAELALPFNPVEVGLGEVNPQVKQLSPTGTVPVLVDAGVIIWESSVMLEYLHDKCATSTLLPYVAAQAARVRSLHAYSDKCVGPALRDLVFEKRSTTTAKWNKQLIADSEQRWLQCQDYLEVQLGQADYFGGTAFSMADCALAARFGVAEAYGAAVDQRHPALVSWYTRVQAGDTWQQAYPLGFISST